MEGTKSISIIQADFGYKKSRNESILLKQISLELEYGELIGIVGINGSGKSTFIRSLCGLQPLLQGKIKMDQKDISELRKNEIATIVSVVLTEKISGFNLTCYDAVAMGRIPYTDLFGNLKAEDRSRIDDALQACGLLDHQHKLLSELSDGLFQKTMIARCLAQETNVMLLDEPGAFLDYAGKHDLFEKLKNLSKVDKKCILISSHELDLLLKYCTKILMLQDQSIQLIRTDEALSNQTFRNISGGYL